MSVDLPDAGANAPATNRRVCHVIFEHSVFDGRVFFKEACSLARAGYEVVLLVPEVRSGWLGRQGELRVAPGESYHRHGVRFETYRYPRRLPSLLGIRRAAARRAILDALRRINPDLCHFHESGLTMEVIADVRQALPKALIVFDFHELFLHQLRDAPDFPERVAQFLSTEARMLGAVDALITVSDFISDYYRTLFAGPVVTIMNCQSARLLPSLPAPAPTEDTFWVVHEGWMRFNRGLRLLVAAAAELTDPTIRILVLGDLPPRERRWFEQESARLGVRGRFEITGMLPYDQVPARLATGAVGIHFVQSANGRTGVSNKFFNYLCFGLPIITLEHPLVAPLVRHADCGTVVSPDPAAVAAALQTLRHDAALRLRQRDHARQLFVEELNWEQMERRLFTLYRELLAARAPA